MKKLIQWIREVNRVTKLRGKLILTARERLACMDAPWRQEADKSNDEVAVLLMNIGLIRIEAVYQGQMAAQNIIRSRQAHLN